uniref:NADH dehydrogenase subunit 4L n=1 Tax=Lepidochelys olivacea TaxID=27788 RepID=B6GV43_LEPOA|nr:NADH dehydrogenase subunit 4L [Lepidochelys olivacea]
MTPLHFSYHSAFIHQHYKPLITPNPFNLQPYYAWESMMLSLIYCPNNMTHPTTNPITYAYPNTNIILLGLRSWYKPILTSSIFTNSWFKPATKPKSSTML